MWITRKRSSASKALQLLRSHLGPGEQCLAPVWSPSQFSQAAPPGSPALSAAPQRPRRLIAHLSPAPAPDSHFGAQPCLFPKAPEVQEGVG